MKKEYKKLTLVCKGCGTTFGLYEGQCTICWKAQYDELEKQRDELAASLEEERGWKREFDMYRRAWIRELGGRLIPKTHEIDALVLTTRQLREDTQRKTMRECAKALYETVTRADVVTLVEKWNNV